MHASRNGIVLALLAVAALSCTPEPRWFKGNLHTHTLWSDGDDYPEMVLDWYRSRGWHFVAISDHNILSKYDIRKDWRFIAHNKHRGLANLQ